MGRIAWLVGVALIVGGIMAGHWGDLVAGACAQAAGSGVVLWASPAPRWAGPLLAAVLLAGIGAAATVDPAAVGFVVPGICHAALYGAMLAAFGRSLRPGRVALVTGLAQRLNKRFRSAMVPYTRQVTWAWCAFAAVQLLGSAALLAVGWIGAWRLWVTGLHPALAIGLGLAEYAMRCRRFPGEHTGLMETVRGIRGMTR